MEKDELIKLIETLGDSLYSAALVRANKGLWELVKEPEVGDYVLEKTTAFLTRDPSLRFGKLIKVCMEPYPLSDEAKKEYEELGEPIPEEKVYYIKLVDGTEMRWTNASFMRIPTERWSNF